MHVLNHKGAAFSVRGPLNIARPVQGWPVIVQAGASEAGRQLAAETAEVIFGAEASLAAGKSFYADIKRRMAAIGRDPRSLKILPAAFVVVGDTVADARGKRARLDSLVHYDSGIGSLNGMLDYDVSGFDPGRAATGHSPHQHQSNPAKAHDRSRPFGTSDHSPAGAKSRQLCRTGVRRHAADHCR